MYANGAGNDIDIDSAIESLKNLNSSEASELIKSMVNTFLTKGNNAYQTNDFKSSSKYFERAHRVSPLDTSYLYYAASSAVNAQDYETSLEYYNQLKNLGFTGIKMNYFAVNSETGVEELFANETTRDFSVKAKTHSNPRDEMEKSKRDDEEAKIVRKEPL